MPLPNKTQKEEQKDMKDTIIKKLGKGGLIAVGLLFFIGLLCIATQNPAMAMGGAALPLVFGMATGVVNDGVSRVRTCKHTHNAATNPGDIIVYNGSVLIAVDVAAANVENVYIYKGRVTLPKEAALAINFGDKVYWVADTNVNKTSAGNTECGFCVEDAAAADTTVTIMLLPGVAVLDLVESTQNTIADPGDAGAIPVTKSGVCAITTAAAETRTLAIPGHIGQILAISMDVDGGDCVITVAAAINQAGNTHITLNDAGDTVVLVGVQKAAGLVWRVLVNDGATLAA
jgi:predicted RecA/RadA family phage recombinase